MRSNGKGIYERDIDYISYTELGKLKYDYRVTLKNGKEIKLKRKVGKKLKEQIKWNQDIKLMVTKFIIMRWKK